jgi:hypothetical protein
MNKNNTNFFSCYFEDGNGEVNHDFFKEMRHLGGWTVSDRHPVNGLKRRTMSTVDILPDKKINNAKVEDLRNIIEKTIMEYATDNNIIFLSGGKDSTTLAHIFNKLDIPFKALSLYSDKSTTSERPVVEQIEKALNIEVEYFKIDVIPNHKFNYWIENPYTAKAKAITELGLENSTIFTGEIGTGEMQINQSLQYTGVMGYRPDDLAHWHVNVCGSHRRINSVKKLYDDHIYIECVDHFRNRFLEWDNHPDVLNRVMFSRLQDEGAFRLFNYGLDSYKWIHPFAEDEFIHTCVNTPSHFKGSKNLYRLMYPDLTDIAWRYPKSGLGIPTF